MTIDAEKRLAAERSLEFLRDGMILGLGSGSTAEIAVRLIGEAVAGGLRVKGVPSSEATRRLAESVGIPLTTLAAHPRLDLTIDGADEVDDALTLIKGGGGALLREKIVAACSARVVIVVDSRKLVARLGAFPLPVAVAAFAWRPAADALAALGGRPRLREAAPDTPFVSDDGHYILDCAFAAIEDAPALAAALDRHPAVMAHGLFVDMTDEVLVGRGQTVERLTRA